MAWKSIKLTGRCMWPNLATAKAYTPKGAKPTEGTDDKAKYSIQILIPKSDKDQIKKIKDHVKDIIDDADISATMKKQLFDTAFNYRDGANKYCLLKDGDIKNARRKEKGEDEDPAIVGMYVFKAARGLKRGVPPVYNRAKEKLSAGLVEQAIVGGYHVMVDVSAYVYNPSDPGVTCGLNGVLLIREDEPFGQRDPFADIEIEQDETSKDESPFGSK